MRNPADTFTLMLSHEINKTAVCGNTCLLALDIEGHPDTSKLKSRLEAFTKQFPLQQHIQKLNCELTISQIFHEQRCETEAEAHKATETLLSTKPVPLQLTCISLPHTTRFIWRWFHPLMDAQGATLLLKHLLSDTPIDLLIEAERETTAPLQVAMNKHSRWQKMKQLWRCMRFIKALNKPRVAVASCHRPQSPALRYHSITLSTEQTRQAHQIARQSAGMFGINLYWIGCMMRALQQLGRTEGDFRVPYAINWRKPNAKHPIWGNQVTFAFAAADQATVADRSKLFPHLVKQHKAFIQQQGDYAMLSVMKLSQCLSMERYAKAVRYNKHRQEASSFWFSYTGKTTIPPSIEGCAISGIQQLSPVTAPPGLAILMHEYQQQLQMSLCHYEAGFSDEEMARLMGVIVEELLFMDPADKPREVG